MKHLQIFMNFVHIIRIRGLYINQHNPKFGSDLRNVSEMRSISVSVGVFTSYPICAPNRAYQKIIKCCDTCSIFETNLSNMMIYDSPARLKQIQ